MELSFSQLAAEFENSKRWETEGANSALEWIRFNCHMTSNAAADRLAVGKRSDELAESRQAMHAGEIGFAHLTVMARTANAIGDCFDERALLDMARETSPGKFHYKCMHYRHAVNAEQYGAEQARQAESRSLLMSTSDDGSLYLSCFLDPVGGAVVRTALEQLARPSGAHDHRERPRRLADALVELAEVQTSIQMQVTSSVETLLALTGAPGAEAEFSLPISSRTAHRWACSSSLSRVLLQDSIVIDVGRAERTIKGAKRRALNTRDQHCRWPGCERPASWCDGHHIRFWTHGGGDDLENLVLLCHRHHRMVHEGQWQLVRTDEGKIVVVAPPTRFALARGPD